VTERSNFDTEAGPLFRAAREPEGVKRAVVRFHRRVDEVLDATIRGHDVKIDCARGCSYCCSMQVDVSPYEAFTLAAWVRTHFDAGRLAAAIARLRHNDERTREVGMEARKRMNLACAFLGDDGACTVYEARPASCRRFHSTRLATCVASYENPADDSIESPMHAAVAHNAQVIVTQARHAARDAGLDADPVDMNRALLEALENPKAWRRWRDGKKPFVG
jgi:Fe-S-cluster containining protein